MKKILYLAYVLLFTVACAPTEKSEISNTDRPTTDREKAKKYAETISFDTKYLSEAEAFALREAAYPYTQTKQQPQSLTNIYSELDQYNIKSVSILNLVEEAFVTNPTPDNLFKNLVPASKNLMFILTHKDSADGYKLLNIEKNVRNGLWAPRVMYSQWQNVQARLPEHVKKTGYSIFSFYAHTFILVSEETGKTVIYNAMGEKENLELLCSNIVNKLKDKNPDGTFKSYGW